MAFRELIKLARERAAAATASVGKRARAPERLAPPLDVALLDEIAGRMDEVHDALTKELPELRKTMEGVKQRLDDQVPKGLQDQEDVDVSEALSSYSPHESLFSADIKNDGDVSVWYALNDATLDFVELKKKEARTISMGRPLINKIYFKCHAGQTSTVRITGTY